MLHDHLKGRYSEVDEINGRVAEVCEGVGRAAPVNAAVAEVTGRVHSGDLKPDPGNLDIVLKMISS